MLFTSAAFLFAFLPAVLLVHRLLPRRLRNGFLLFASYVFYGWWRADFLLLILGSTALDFVCARQITRAGPASRGSTPAARRARRVRLAWLWTSLAANLAVLGVFKYARFGLETLEGILAPAGGAVLSETWAGALLPVGLSFYTLQTMSYTIDVYRGHVAPARSFVDFACYVALFPQLVAGPIVRWSTLAPQLARRELGLARFSRGALLFQIGFAKKVLLADTLGGLVGRVYDQAACGLVEAWTATLAFALQLYFDFSGYTDMALGLGLMLGFVLPENFDSPYRAASIGEFWRRWHVSLSSWIRDYLYLPLGGNRGGAVARLAVLFATMGLAGLWHGASWTFVLWGLAHAALMALERLSPRRSLVPGAPRGLRVLVTFLAFLVTLVLFRASTLGGASTLWRAMAGVGGERWFVNTVPGRQELVALGVGLAIVFLAPPARTLVARRSWLFELAIAAAFAVAVVELFFRAQTPFLYFRF